MPWTDKPDSRTSIVVRKTFYKTGVAREFATRRRHIHNAPRVVSTSANTVELEYVPGRILQAHEYGVLDLMYHVAWKDADTDSPRNKTFVQDMYWLKPMTRAMHWDKEYRLPSWVEDFCHQHKPLMTDKWHGDFCHENIIVTEDGRVSLIDWRPCPLVGDVYYDLAKFWKGLQFEHATQQPRCNTGVYEAWLVYHGYSVDTVRRLYALIILSMSGCHHNAVGHSLFEMGVDLLEKF